MSDYPTRPLKKGTATNGTVYDTLCKIGMPPWEAWNAICDAAERLKPDDEGRPYLVANDGLCWYADFPGETFTKETK